MNKLHKIDIKIVMKSENKGSHAEYTSDVDSCDSADKYFNVYSASTRCGYKVKDKL